MCGKVDYESPSPRIHTIFIGYTNHPLEGRCEFPCDIHRRKETSLRSWKHTKQCGKPTTCRFVYPRLPPANYSQLKKDWFKSNDPTLGSGFNGRMIDFAALWGLAGPDFSVPCLQLMALK